jgi:hypothetical protein
MKSILKIFLFLLIYLSATTSYSQRDSSQMLTKSNLDISVGFSHNYWSADGNGLFLGITFFDRLLINFSSVKNDDVTYASYPYPVTYQSSTKYLGANYILSSFGNRIRLILGGSMLFENQKISSSIYSNDEYNYQYFTLNLGTDIKVNEQIKFFALTQSTYFSDYYNVSLGFKFRVLDSKYFKSLRKIKPIKIKNIQIY